MYLESTLDRVRPLTAGDDRVCKLLPVWEKPTLSPAELLILGRRVEHLREAEEKESKEDPPGHQGSSEKG